MHVMLQRTIKKAIRLRTYEFLLSASVGVFVVSDKMGIVKVVKLRSVELERARYLTAVNWGRKTPPTLARLASARFCLLQCRFRPRVKTNVNQLLVSSTLCLQPMKISCHLMTPRRSLCS
jgi:hypothetical protein